MSLLEYRLPDLGEGLQEAEIVSWRVAPGDVVREDDILVEIQTDKSLVDIPAPCDGVVRALGAEEGTVLPVGDVLATFEVQQKPAPGDGDGRRVLASPSTRRRAVELEVRLGDIEGTGPHERVTRDDVERAAAAAGGEPPTPAAPTQPASPAPPETPARQTGAPAGRGDEVMPLRGLRRQIARTMTAAATIPTIHEWRDVDARELLRVRQRLRAHYEDQGTRITLLPIIVKAAVVTLRRHPSFNARLDVEREEIVYRRRYHIGIATATPDGLIVPVLTDADQRSVLDLARELKRLSAAAVERRIAPDDTRDPTFTISNYGSFGTRVGAPLIRPPGGRDPRCGPCPRQGRAG